MKDRRQKFDLENTDQTDLYGKKAGNEFMNFDGEEGMFGMNDMYNDPGFQRLDNGMGVNENVEEMRKQNQNIAKAGAALAMGQTIED